VVDMQQLEAFVGEWRMVAPGFELPADVADAARTTFEWTLGGAFLLERSTIPVPEAPDALMVIAPGEAGYTQHYFDSRGVVRLYAMTFDGRDWTLERRSADFSALDFQQRYTGRFDEDGDAVHGRWERSQDGREWELDFELGYQRVA
jgi:hypothetical protein